MFALSRKILGFLFGWLVRKPEAPQNENFFSKRAREIATHAMEEIAYDKALGSPITVNEHIRDVELQIVELLNQYREFLNKEKPEE